MTQKIKILIFDLDGTLIDAYPAIFYSVHYVLDKLGLPGTDDEKIRRSVGWGDLNLLRRFIPEDMIVKGRKMFAEHHEEALRSILPDGRRGVSLFPGADGLLRELKGKGYTLAVASNRHSWSSKSILEFLGIADLFDAVVCADQLKPKPDPAMLLEILKKFDCRPENALYIGDMVIDIETARNAGVQAISVLTGSSTKEDIVPLKPFRIIDKISTVADIVEGLKTDNIRTQK